jgi:cytochrome c oxidase subunit II
VGRVAERAVIAGLLPQPASAHAAMLDAVLFDIHWHMLAVFLLFFGIFVTALVRFREGRHPDPRPTGPGWRWPLVAMGAVVAGDVGLLVTRALPAWDARMTPPAAGAQPPLEIRVVAEQFAWHVHYAGPDGRFGEAGAMHISATNPVGIDRDDPAGADDIGLTNILMLPLQRPVVIQLTSRDVIHSFTLPEMRVKQDITPGMTTRTWFTPIAEGAWDIVCSQLCGLGHYRMRGEYRVVSPEEWERWQDDEVALLAPAR